MKRNCIAVIVVLMITCIQFVTLAVNDDLTSLLDKVQISASEEKDEVQKAIDEFNVKERLFKNKQEFNNEALLRITNADDLTYGTPYKVVIATKTVIDALLEGKNLAEVVADAPYYWEVPVLLKTDSNKAVSSFYVRKIDGKWQVGEIGAFLTEEDLAFSSDSNTIKTVLQKNDLENVNSMYHLRIAPINQDYLYLNGVDQEYFIPINHVGIGAKYNRIGVKDANQEKTKLTRDQVIDLFSDQLRGNKENINTDPIRYGDSVSNPKNNSPFIIYLILGFSAVVLLGWMVLRKKMTTDK